MSCEEVILYFKERAILYLQSLYYNLNLVINNIGVGHSSYEYNIKKEAKLVPASLPNFIFISRCYVIKD